MNRTNWLALVVTSALGALSASSAGAAPITFSNATATFHQTFDRNWSPAEMIDGTTTGFNGWAIFRNDGQGDQTQSENALFTLSTALASGTQSITLTIFQNYGSSHELGDFRLGYTTDVSPTLTSAENVMTITGASASSGATFSSTAAGQLLVGGTLPAGDVYTINASFNAAAAVTGIFLNAINDGASGLPTGGPGRQPSNGNFVINEFTADAVAQVSAVPEQSTSALVLLGLVAVGVVARRRAR